MVGKDFNELGRVEVGVKVKVRQVNRAKESVVRHNRVEENVDAG